MDRQDDIEIFYSDRVQAILDRITIILVYLNIKQFKYIFILNDKYFYTLIYLFDFVVRKKYCSY